MSFRKWILPVLMCVLIAPAFAVAQDRGADGNQDRGQDRGNGGGGGGGNRGNRDPAQMRERMMSRLKEQMGATDDEWKVMEPKINKVAEAQREARAGNFGGGGRGGDRGGDGQPQTALGKASQDLRDTLQNKDASPEEITQKLKGFRDAREKAQDDLRTAQKDLKEILTQRQEAVLVVNGMLE